MRRSAAALLCHLSAVRAGEVVRSATRAVVDEWMFTVEDITDKILMGSAKILKSQLASVAGRGGAYAC